MNRFKATLFLVIGCLIIVAAWFQLYVAYQFKTNAKHAEGIVIQLNHGGSHPQIQFMTEERESVSYAQNGLIFGYHAGEKVDVLYQPSQPRNASVNTFGATWGFPSLFFIVGIVFVFISWQLKPSVVSDK